MLFWKMDFPPLDLSADSHSGLLMACLLERKEWLSRRYLESRKLFSCLTKDLIRVVCFGVVTDWGFGLLVPSEPSWDHEHPGWRVCHYARSGWGSGSDTAAETPDADRESWALQQLEPRLHYSPLRWEGMARDQGSTGKGKLSFSVSICFKSLGLSPFFSWGNWKQYPCSFICLTRVFTAHGFILREFFFSVSLLFTQHWFIQSTTWDLWSIWESDTKDSIRFCVFLNHESPWYLYQTSEGMDFCLASVYNHKPAFLTCSCPLGIYKFQRLTFGVCAYKMHDYWVPTRYRICMSASDTKISKSRSWYFLVL